MARSWKALKRNTLKHLETGASYMKTFIYYGAIPTIVYLSLTTEPKVNIGAMLSAFKE